MRNATLDHDVIVVGGGATGLTTAWRAAQHGLNVTLIDARDEGGASWAAAGMLAPVTEASFGEEQLLALTVAASAAWPRFAEELEAATGIATGYRQGGTLLVARDDDDVEVLLRLHHFQQACGLDSRRLRRAEARELEPFLAPTVRGAIYAPGDHQVDNRSLLGALRTACERTGVALRDARVVALHEPCDGARPAIADGGTGEGVTLEDGSVVRAATVVLASGAWTSRIAGVPAWLRHSVRPVKGQILRLAGPTPLLTRTVRGRDVYLVPRADGRLVVGATMEEQGFDTRVTAGAVRDLLTAGEELVPGIRELEVEEVSAGLRPGSPDNAPLLGAAGRGSLLVTTGHYRNGVLLAPVTAQAIVDLLLSRSTPLDLHAVRPSRFLPATLPVPRSDTSRSLEAAKGRIR